MTTTDASLRSTGICWDSVVPAVRKEGYPDTKAADAAQLKYGTGISGTGLRQCKGDGKNMQTTIYENAEWKFLLTTNAGEDAPFHALITREPVPAAGGAVVKLLDYTWAAPLRVAMELTDVQADEAAGALDFALKLTVHHVTGMVQGEFTETESYTVYDAFGDGIICEATDIVRKTRFAAAERHLEHLPHRTYPADENGLQGPYGHPAINKLPPQPPIPHKKHPEV